MIPPLSSLDLRGVTDTLRRWMAGLDAWVRSMGTAARLNADADTGLTGNSDQVLPTQKAVKAYADAITAAVGAGYQPLDSDLTAIAALATTAFGRALLTEASATSLVGTLGLATLYQPLDSDLTAIAGLSTTAFGRALLTETNAASVIATLGLATLYQPLDSDLTAIAGLGTTGLVTRTGAGTMATRTLTGPAAGFTITDGNGVSGNPTFVLADDLAAVEGLSGTGMASRTAANTWALRQIAGTANEIGVTDGTGAAGNPTISLPTNITLTGKNITGGTFTGITDIAVADGGTGASTAIGAIDALFTQGTTIASAATTDLSTATGVYSIVSGSVTITALGIVPAGSIRIVRFSGAPLITHNATSLYLPGLADIQAASGDSAIFVSHGSGNWRCIHYEPASELPVNRGGTGAVTLTGIVKGNGTSAFSSASAGTDYYAPGSTDVAVADGGTGASSASAARTNLGLAIGSDVQAYGALLDGLTALATTGHIVRTGAGTVAARTLTAPAAGISVSNGDGVSGNPTLALANDLAALEAMSGTGIVARTGSETYAQRTITGTANEISVANGDGVSGNPTVSLPSTIALAGKTITGLAASSVTNTAAGNIAATNVQTALNELDTEKVAKAGDTMTGNLALNGVAAAISLTSSSSGATITLSPLGGGSSITLSPVSGGATFSALAAPGSAATFDINAEGNVAATYFTRNFRDAAFSGAMQWVHSRGTRTAQAGLITNDQTMRLVGSGWDGVSSNRTSVQITGLVVAAAPGPTDFESTIVFDASPAASVTLTELMRLRHSTGMSLFSNVVIDQNRHFRLRSYTIATLPSASTAGQMIYCSDLGGGGGLLVADGTSWVAMRTRFGSVTSNADFTLTPLSSAQEIKHTGTLTANRTVTLSTTNARNGSRFHFTAKHGNTGGPWTISIGGLKSLATGEWCIVEYDGAAYQLIAFGTGI